MKRDKLVLTLRINSVVCLIKYYEVELAVSPKVKCINLSLSKKAIVPAKFTHISIYMQSTKHDLGKNDS